MDDIYSEAQLKELQTSMGEGDEFIDKTSPLLKEDYELIGEFVQMYCWADLNGRRLVNQLRKINRNDGDEFASRLGDKQVLEHLVGEAEKLDGLPKVREGVLKAVGILDMHRLRRHEFSHWSFRRVSGLEVYVLLTMSKSDAERRGIIISTERALSYGLISVGALRSELEKLKGHIEYLAHLVAFLAEHQELSDASG